MWEPINWVPGAWVRSLAPEPGVRQGLSSSLLCLQVGKTLAPNSETEGVRGAPASTWASSEKRLGVHH